MLKEAKRIVVKVGSSLIADEAGGTVRGQWLQTLAEDIAAWQKEGKQVAVVTSGAVALGRRLLKLKGPLQLEEKQAAAACGQISLSVAWRDAFAAHGLPVAQLLLTADDSEVRNRYLNARATLFTLQALGAVPVINENDTVATAELRVGDNDRLSARVAAMTEADCLILLSDIDGLYSDNPKINPQAEFIPEIKGNITPEIEAMAGGAGSSVGTGGMSTKLAAAKIALAAGCHMIIAAGQPEHPLRALRDGARHTRFVAGLSPLSARKRWISGMLSAAGAVVVDEGAERALKSGKSLLPAGVKSVEGDFSRGDAVLIRSLEGRMIGKGLSAYSSADAARICGRQSNEIETILGFKGRVALIHRDDMVLE